MDVTSLTRKQKRIKDWNSYLEAEIVHDDIRVQMAEDLKIYRNLIAKCWEADEATEEDIFSLEDLERKLEAQFAEARLIAR